jgi:tRNA-dihydrouridine synthase
MAGVSEAPFRQVCQALGADVLMTEFLSSEAIRRGIRRTIEGAEFAEAERPIGV